MRNRIVGGIALALGVCVVIILVMDGRWENHDTVRPIKSLLGGILFIGLGAWYLLRGARAEPWRDQENSLPDQNGRANIPTSTSPDLKSILTDLESDPSFQALCQKVEVEMREKARQLERSSDAKI